MRTAAKGHHGESECLRREGSSGTYGQARVINVTQRDPRTALVGRGQVLVQWTTHLSGRRT